MPLTLGQLENQEATLEFDFQGETVKIRYNIGAYTPGFEEGLLTDLGDRTTPTQVATRYLDKILLGWEGIEETEGVALDFTPENLRRLPAYFLDEVVKKIREDANPALGEEGKG